MFFSYGGACRKTPGSIDTGLFGPEFKRAEFFGGILPDVNGEVPIATRTGG